MNLQVAALLLLLLLVLWLVLRRRQAKPADAPKPAARLSRATTAYHAVSIKFDSRACAAAKDLEGRRFLSAAAPRLPLPDCDATECNCRFAHHDDRRSGKDRRSPFGPSRFGAATGNYQIEKRQGTDRRRKDPENFR